MGRQKPNKPRREKPVWGSREMDICMAEAVKMSLRSNSVTAATCTRLSGRADAMLVRNFEDFDSVIEAMAWLQNTDSDIFLVLPDVIELECRLAELPNLDKGTLLFDAATQRTACIYRYDNALEV